MTTLDGQLLFKQFNHKFRVLENGICQSETRSSRAIHWVKLPSLPFDRTYAEFITLLKWTDPKSQAHLRVAIAMCVGHPRSLNMLCDVIISHPDETEVWMWIKHLSTFINKDYMPLKDLVCCLAASITSQNVGKLKETSKEHTYGFWLSRGSITIQNETFIPLVSPLLLHRLFTNHKSLHPVSDNEREEYQLCTLFHCIYESLFTVIERRSWETFTSQYFLLRLWAHVASNYPNMFPVSNNITNVKLSVLLNIKSDYIYGGDVDLNIGVHNSIRTAIYKTHCNNETWRSVVDFQLCTFSHNQPGFDVLCKFGEYLVLMENKWSDESTVDAKFTINDMLLKLKHTQEIFESIGWPEEKNHMDCCGLEKCASWCE